MDEAFWRSELEFWTDLAEWRKSMGWDTRIADAQIALATRMLDGVV